MEFELLEYGCIYENDKYDVWFEPVTDEVDGFVIRNKDGSIKDIYVSRTNLIK